MTPYGEDAQTEHSAAASWAGEKGGRMHKGMAWKALCGALLVTVAATAWAGVFGTGRYNTVTKYAGNGPEVQPVYADITTDSGTGNQKIGFYKKRSGILYKEFNIDPVTSGGAGGRLPYHKLFNKSGETVGELQHYYDYGFTLRLYSQPGVFYRGVR